MTDNNPSVMLVASEFSPLARSGELGDVTGNLAKALARQGCRVAVALPAYRRVLDMDLPWETVAPDLPVRLGDLHLTADILGGDLADGVKRKGLKMGVIVS